MQHLIPNELSKLVDQKNLIMQNKPNFQKLKVNITSTNINDYGNNQSYGCRQNEPNSNPISDNFPNIEFFKIYEIEVG